MTSALWVLVTGLKPRLSPPPDDDLGLRRPSGPPACRICFQEDQQCGFTAAERGSAYSFGPTVILCQSPNLVSIVPQRKIWWMCKQPIEESAARSSSRLEGYASQGPEIRGDGVFAKGALSLNKDTAPSSSLTGGRAGACQD
jgi:hypothetical protein